MAAISRLRPLLKTPRCGPNAFSAPGQARSASTAAGENGQSFFASRLNLALGVSVAGGLAVYTRLYGLPFVSEAHAMTMAEHGMHPPEWPFNHKAFLPVPSSFDHASIRRGFQVYREVCASCHSLKRVPWRRLVGVSHTADEIKAAAADVEYEDGPNDEGEMFTRPGKLADYLPSPYPNDEAARNGNAGALPPDLSLMILARHGGVDYVYSLLTGYRDAPAGVHVGQNLNYNPYFPGGAIAMARVLYDGLVEFDDGTPATTSQMAKDVVTFLDWAGSPETDERRLLGWQVSIATLLAMVGTIWLKRRIWTHVKHRRFAYHPPSSSSGDGAHAH